MPLSVAKAIPVPKSTILGIVKAVLSQTGTIIPKLDY